jgi:hypothetical protein
VPAAAGNEIGVRSPVRADGKASSAYWTTCDGRAMFESDEITEFVKLSEGN